MKKTLLLTTALGLLGASSLTAATVDIYITGSTAFRANVYTASQKLFVGANPNVFYGSSTNGGADSGFSSKTGSWCMTGTPIAALTSISGSTLVIHGLFTGSIQGMQTVEQKTKLIWATPAGTVGGATSGYVTNTPTIGFSDASGLTTPYAASGNYIEEKVCVQPFVFAKATGSGAAVTALANIKNVSWEQLEFGIPNGFIPLSAWTYKSADTNTPIYLVQRTKDSGTRRIETAEQYFGYNDTVGINIYDHTNNVWFAPTSNNTSNSVTGGSPYGVVGSAGNANANLNWGPGYVAGSDIATALGYYQSADTGVAFLSMNDSKGVTTTNWSQVISFNGYWPTTAGVGINVGNTTTNDYSPICEGYYPCWGYEVMVHPIDMTQYSDQTVTSSQLGSNVTPGPTGSFLGVFNAQTIINGGSPLTGSIENEIELSKTVSPGATAIRLSDMKSNRQVDGNTISPY
jgi:hypothetical protein